MCVCVCVCVCVVVAEFEVLGWKMQDRSLSLCHGWDAVEKMQLSTHTRTHTHAHMHTHTQRDIMHTQSLVSWASSQSCLHLLQLVFHPLFTCLGKQNVIFRKGRHSKHSSRYSLSSWLTFNSLLFLNACRFVSAWLGEQTQHNKWISPSSVSLCYASLFPFIPHLNNVEMITVEYEPAF